VNEFVDASDFGRFADVNLDVIDTWLAADPVDSTCGDDGPVDVTTGALTGMLLVVDTTLPTDVICIDGGTLVGWDCGALDDMLDNMEVIIIEVGELDRIWIDGFSGTLVASDVDLKDAATDGKLTDDTWLPIDITLREDIMLLLEKCDVIIIDTEWEECTECSGLDGELEMTTDGLIGVLLVPVATDLKDVATEGVVTVEGGRLPMDITFNDDTALRLKKLKVAPADPDLMDVLLEWNWPEGELDITWIDGFGGILLVSVDDDLKDLATDGTVTIDGGWLPRDITLREDMALEKSEVVIVDCTELEPPNGELEMTLIEGLGGALLVSTESDFIDLATEGFVWIDVGWLPTDITVRDEAAGPLEKCELVAPDWAEFPIECELDDGELENNWNDGCGLMVLVSRENDFSDLATESTWLPTDITFSEDTKLLLKRCEVTFVDSVELEVLASDNWPDWEADITWIEGLGTIESGRLDLATDGFIWVDDGWLPTDITVRDEVAAPLEKCELAAPDRNEFFVDLKLDGELEIIWMEGCGGMALVSSENNFIDLATEFTWLPTDITFSEDTKLLLEKWEVVLVDSVEPEALAWENWPDWEADITWIDGLGSIETDLATEGFIWVDDGWLPTDITLRDEVAAPLEKCEFAAPDWTESLVECELDGKLEITWIEGCGGILLASAENDFVDLAADCTWLPTEITFNEDITLLPEKCEVILVDSEGLEALALESCPDWEAEITWIDGFGSIESDIADLATEGFIWVDEGWVPIDITLRDEVPSPLNKGELVATDWKEFLVECELDGELEITWMEGCGSIALVSKVNDFIDPAIDCTWLPTEITFSEERKLLLENSEVVLVDSAVLEALAIENWPDRGVDITWIDGFGCLLVSAENEINAWLPMDMTFRDGDVLLLENWEDVVADWMALILENGRVECDIVMIWIDGLLLGPGALVGIDPIDIIWMDGGLLILKHTKADDAEALGVDPGTDPIEMGTKLPGNDPEAANFPLPREDVRIDPTETSCNGNDTVVMLVMLLDDQFPWLTAKET
jgi:uncharacterized lipoprotein NlpE involved in copper resistance